MAALRYMHAFSSYVLVRVHMLVKHVLSENSIKVQICMYFLYFTHSYVYLKKRKKKVHIYTCIYIKYLNANEIQTE